MNRQPTPPRDSRKADLAKIHIGKKQLGLDDETYRLMLFTVARVHSSKDLDEAGRRAVLEHMRSRGFRSDASRRREYPGRPHNVDGNPQLKKIEALLTDARRPWTYVDAMAKRMFGVERLAWCNADQLQRLIAALEYDKARRSREAARP